MKSKAVKGLKNLKEHYNKEKIVLTYENLRFRNLAGKIQHQREISILNEFIKEINPKLILEIATGPGRLTKHIKVPYKAIGIDSSKNMIKSARKKCGKNWSFKVANVMKMPFEKKRFDLIYTFRLLTHFRKTERENAYNEINRILKKKGYFIMNMGNKSYHKPKVLQLILNLYHIFFPVKKQKYLPEIYNTSLTLNQIKKELKDNKFIVKKIYGVNYYNTYILLLLALSKRVSMFNDNLKKIILNVENRNQSKLNNYAEFILICRKKWKQ